MRKGLRLLKLLAGSCMDILARFCASSSIPMAAARWCRFLLGGVILGGVHGIEGPAGAFLVERCFILHIDDGGSRRRGAVETRRPMRGDGLAQVEVVVWRQGGVDDGVT